MERSAALAFLWVPALRCYREAQPMGTLSQTLHVTFKLSVSFKNKGTFSCTNAKCNEKEKKKGMHSHTCPSF